MPTPPLSDAECQAAVNAVARHGGVKTAADALGINRLTLTNRLRVAKARGFRPTQFSVKAPAGEALPVDAIRRRRKEQFAQLRQAKLDRVLTPLKVLTDGPIGIVHFGDPHLDDDGTDLEKIEQHTEIVRKTEGLFAANATNARCIVVRWPGQMWASDPTSTTPSAMRNSTTARFSLSAVALYDGRLSSMTGSVILCRVSMALRRDCVALDEIPSASATFCALAKSRHNAMNSASLTVGAGISS